MVLVVISLWIGSAVAGWHLWWPWLFVPIIVIGSHIAKVTANMRTIRDRNGLPSSRSVTPSHSMAAANTQLLAVTLIQHLAIFGASAGVNWIVG